MLQKILVIDDSEVIHRLLQARLCNEAAELHFALEGAHGVEMALDLQPDLILLDIDMPDPDGFEVCRRLKTDQRTVHIPIIFVTGDASTEQKIKGLELGASDYITQPFDPAELRARVRATLRSKYLMDLLEKKAMVDGLTGLWNRIYFEARFNSEVARARRGPNTFACLMIDLDHFKNINDTFGHGTGDEVLRGIGQILTDNCRGEDCACRYGGEEFAVLACNTTSEDAVGLAERIRSAIEQHDFRKDGKPVAVTCSIGVADLRHVPPPGVVELADQALYQAKAEGRNRVVTTEIQPDVEVIESPDTVKVA
jgi:diguanylate cyclase (GGDEF)-like protein